MTHGDTVAADTVLDIITFFRFSNWLPYVFDSFISESLQYKQMMSAIK